MLWILLSPLSPCFVLSCHLLASFLQRSIPQPLRSPIWAIQEETVMREQCSGDLSTCLRAGLVTFPCCFFPPFFFPIFFLPFFIGWGNFVLFQTLCQALPCPVWWSRGFPAGSYTLPPAWQGPLCTTSTEGNTITTELYFTMMICTSETVI